MGDAVWDARAPQRSGGRRGVRVITVASPEDGPWEPRMYAYWPNAYVRGDTVFVFAGHADGRPRFFKIDLASGAVDPLGAIMGYGGTSEGWYWNREGRIYVCDGPRLRRVNPFDPNEDDVVMDIGAMFQGCRLWQAHSSDDGVTHSATVEQIVEDGPYPRLGTVVQHRGSLNFYGAEGRLDESQVTRSGSHVVIQENDDNRVVDVATGDVRLLRDEDGAVAHADVGETIVLGEDNWAGACVLWDLLQPLTPDRKRILFRTSNMGHVSLRNGRCLLSDDDHIGLVALDGSGVTWLLPHGQQVTTYDTQVQANLDPTGRVACYISNGAIHLLELPS